MTHINQTNRSLEDAIAAIEDLKGDLANNVYEICLNLVICDLRRFRHPLFGSPIFRHFRAIANRQIDAGLVWAFNGDKFRIERLIGIPEEVQRNIVAGHLFTVASVDTKTGEIVEKQYSAVDMPKATFARFFPGGGKRATFSEQKAALEIELQNAAAKRQEAAKNGKKIQVNTVRRTIRVPGETATLEQITEALRKFGLTVTKLDTEKEAA